MRSDDRRLKAFVGSTDASRDARDAASAAARSSSVSRASATTELTTAAETPFPRSSLRHGSAPGALDAEPLLGQLAREGLVVDQADHLQAAEDLIDL